MTKYNAHTDQWMDSYSHGLRMEMLIKWFRINIGQRNVQSHSSKHMFLRKKNETETNMRFENSRSKAIVSRLWRLGTVRAQPCEVT